MKTLSTIFIIFGFVLTGFTQDLDTLLYNGSSNLRIDLVILGDGYQESELPKFIGDAKNTLNALFDQAPFKQYKNYFNAYSISTASVESGAALSPDKLIDNYYGSTYGYAGIDRLLVPTKPGAAWAILAEKVPAYDHVLMIVNHTKYGGSGGWLATASTSPQSFEVMIHELGHSFGQLADEYWAGPQYASERANMTRETSPENVRWKNWVGEQGIGIYAYPENTTWQRPHQQCRMQYLGYPFCAVCREAIIDRIHAFTVFVDSYSPIEDAIQNSNTFALQLIAPSPNTLKTKWTFNQGTIPTHDDEFTLGEDELASLPDTLIAEVMDTTEYNRRDQVFVSRVQWILYSDIQGNMTKDRIDRPVAQPDPPITGIPRESAVATSLYPNPYHDKVSIDYQLKTPQYVKIRIVDFNGKVVGSDDLFQSAGPHRLEPNMRSLKNGIVMLYTNGKWQSFKVMKKN